MDYGIVMISSYYPYNNTFSDPYCSIYLPLSKPYLLMLPMVYTWYVAIYYPWYTYGMLLHVVGDAVG